MKQFIRFKDLPPDEKSGVYDGDLGVIRHEAGVSCYECINHGDVYKIILPSLCSGIFFDIQNFLSQYQDGKIPVHLVKGNQVGTGTLGEPVIKNVSIISKLELVETEHPKPEFKMDRTSKQLKCIKSTEHRQIKEIGYEEG